MNKKLYAALEGLLYLAGEDGLTLTQIAIALEVSEDDAKLMVEALKNEYDRNGRGITIIHTANAYRMTTSERYYEFYKRIYQDQYRTRLSNAAMEVLAIIAYKQPITRAEIEHIRGTNSDHIVRRLLAMSLIKEVGRLDAPGKPVLLGTTDDFLDYFNLVSLDELPELLEDIDEEKTKEQALFT